MALIKSHVDPVATARGSDTASICKTKFASPTCEKVVMQFEVGPALLRAITGGTPVLPRQLFRSAGAGGANVLHGFLFL